MGLICRMKRVILIPLIALALVMTGLSATAASAYGADTQPQAKEPYTYTVRIFAGNQGSIDGKPILVKTGLNPGDRFTFYQGNVDVANDSRYYVRGLREAGRDNDTFLVNPSFEVMKDTDYVVAYGIRGQDVAYTVRYVDTAGNSLAEDDTFYGNVGDSPVIAYRYIEGYMPQVYNLTGELYDDPARNVYTFVYDSLGAGAEGATTPADGTAGAATDAAATVATAGQLIGDDGVPAAAPDEIRDIRDDENPLAAALDNFLEGSQILQNVWAIVIGSVALLAIIVSIVVLALRRRKKESADDGQD